MTEWSVREEGKRLLRFKWLMAKTYNFIAESIIPTVPLAASSSLSGAPSMKPHYLTSAILLGRRESVVIEEGGDEGISSSTMERCNLLSDSS